MRGLGLPYSSSAPSLSLPISFLIVWRPSSHGTFFHSTLLSSPQDMQKAFARYKTLMLSLNLGGRELQGETGPEVQQLQEDMCSMNRSWTKACGSLEEWEDNLRNSFMQCQVRKLNKEYCVNLCATEKSSLCKLTSGIRVYFVYFCVFICV